MFRTLALPLIAALALSGPAMAQDGFDIVTELQQGPGNIAVTPDGRIVISQHQFYAPQYRVVEVMDDGTTVPFPTPRWSGATGPDGIGLDAVLGLRADANGIVWMLDNGSSPPKLVGWDTTEDQLHRVIYIPPPATIDGSFHNDLAVDVDNRAIYLADIGPGPDRGAIVVVDLDTGLSRRVLEGHESTSAEDVPMVIDGTPVRVLGPDGAPVEPRIGINPITIDPDATWVYYGAMHGTAVYRVRSSDLRDASLSPEELAARVERYGDKPVSDGISVDGAGNVYITDVTSNGIGVTRPDGSYDLLFQNERVSWPDGISTGPDGYMYATVNRLHRSAALNAGVAESSPPYYIIRFRPLAPGAVGR